MSLRPISARWFEVLTARDDLVRTVEILARSGKVQLETYSETTKRLVMPDLRDRFEVYNRLSRRYQAYWPASGIQPSELPGKPSERLDKALDELLAWKSDADRLVTELEKLSAERSELDLVADWCPVRAVNTIPTD